jgi:hypothetical protein
MSGNGGIAVCILNLSTHWRWGGEWSPSCLGHFTPGKESFSTQCIGGLVGLRSSLDTVEKKNPLPPPHIKPWFSHTCHLFSTLLYSVDICFFLRTRKISSGSSWRGLSQYGNLSWIWIGAGYLIGWQWNMIQALFCPDYQRSCCQLLKSSCTLRKRRRRRCC